MKKVTENIEKVGKVSDDIDNLLHALSIPIPPQQHLDALRGVLPRLRDELRTVFVSETDYDPWK